jgi:hypothetical protein
MRTTLTRRKATLIDLRTLRLVRIRRRFDIGGSTDPNTLPPEIGYEYRETVVAWTARLEREQGRATCPW